MIRTRSKPFESWERKHRRFADQRIESDRGLGDTIFRLRGEDGLRANVKRHVSAKQSTVALNHLYPFPAPSKAEDAKRLTAMRGAGLGRTLVIVGNGPSHYEASLEKLAGVAGIDTMMVNRPYVPIWPTTYWVYFDPSVPRQNLATLGAYRGTVFTGSATRFDTGRTIFLRGSYQFGHDLTKGVMIRYRKDQAGTTTAGAIQLAEWLAYDRVFITGVDLGAGADGKLYPWGSNPVCPDPVRLKRFPDEDEVLSKCGEELAGNASRFTFCSSYLTGRKLLRWFDVIPHRGAADAILKAAAEVAANPRKVCPEIPRRREPETIGDEFDQKAERDRMIDGGCCGKPSAVT